MDTHKFEISHDHAMSSNDVSRHPWNTSTVCFRLPIVMYFPRCLLTWRDRVSILTLIRHLSLFSCFLADTLSQLFPLCRPMQESSPNDR